MMISTANDEVRGNMASPGSISRGVRAREYGVEQVVHTTLTFNAEDARARPADLLWQMMMTTTIIIMSLCIFILFFPF